MGYTQPSCKRSRAKRTIVMKTVQLSFLIIVGVAVSTARLSVEVRLHSYSNPDSEDCDGGHCEGGIGNCDNRFEFCVRAVGGISCLTPPIISNDISEDIFTFGTSELSELGISNPLRFSSISTSSELGLFVTVTDEDDFNPDDSVDRFFIPFDNQQRADSTFSPPITYSGSCGRARLEVSINITSLCPSNTFGPQCNIICEERLDQNTCNYLGGRKCLGNYAPIDCNECITGFQAPGCVTCAPDYYPPNICQIFCQPRNDALGHYTCGTSGKIVCLPKYTDPSTNCVMCQGNFKEPDCTECDAKFQGPNCDMCVPNYYPQGICVKFCQPRNDALGHYTCGPSGEIVCLPKYTDNSTNCVMCQGNFEEPDCTECDANFQGPNCDMCVPNYYPQGICVKFCQPRNDALGHYTCGPSGEIVCLPKYTDNSTNCVMCQGNFEKPDCTECDAKFQGPNCDMCVPNYYPQGICVKFCQPRNDFLGHFTCNPVTGEKECLPGFEDPATDCRQMSATSTSKSGSSAFVGSVGFYVVVAIFAGVPILALITILFILCMMCTLSNNFSCPNIECSCPTFDCSCPTFDCTCPKIDCDDCCTCEKFCSGFFKWLTCGLKCDDTNPALLCIIVILGILAAPAVIVIIAVVCPIILIVACLLYSLRCDS